MKAFKVIYRNGHLINVDSKEEVYLIHDKEYTITGGDSDFSEVGLRRDLKLTKTTEEKELEMISNYGEGNFELLFGAGQVFFFRLGNSRRFSHEKQEAYIFTCNIEEDLYIYLPKQKDEKDPLNWRLADCKCRVEECLTKNLILSKQITSRSLNRLFNDMVQYYFSMQRTGSTNVFITFNPLVASEIRISFESIRQKQFEDLDYHRLKTINERLKRNKV